MDLQLSLSNFPSKSVIAYEGVKDATVPLDSLPSVHHTLISITRESMYLRLIDYQDDVFLASKVRFLSAINVFQWDKYVNGAYQSKHESRNGCCTRHRLIFLLVLSCTT